MPRLTVLTLLVILHTVRSAPAAEVDGLTFFENKVRPVLVEHCYSCHSVKEKKNRGGLYLDSRQAMLKGGDTGPAIVPGKPDQSLLIQAIRHTGDLKMPAKNRLADRVVADLTRWVEMGAPAPDSATAALVTGIDWIKGKAFWSFQPVRRPALPTVKDAHWPRNAIDHFVLARLETEGLKPVEGADRRTLLRRVTFDLTGLPPTPEEMAHFLADSRPDAYERVVDRLLSSKAYGERYGRHWLDVARYAEDQAHTFGVKPYTQAWRYRDWVIQALNDDLPYDQFVRLQIAADLLAEATIADRSALGFFGLGAQYYKNSDAARATADELDDRVDTFARGFLGLTVSCARCHDHKYDPIPTQDYYSLAGVFHSSRLAEVYLAPQEQVEQYQAAQKRLQDADNAVKTFLRVEKAALAAVRADRLGDYLLGTWKVRATGKPVGEVARGEGLDPTILDRTMKLVRNNKNARLNALLEPWNKSTAGQQEPPEELRAAAEKLQQRALELLKREERSLKAEERALVQAFFGDNGVFALPEKRVVEHLSVEKKQHLEQLRATLGQIQREQPAAPPTAHGLAEATPTDLKVYLRGNPAQQGPMAPRRFLRILSQEEPPPFRQGSGRVELANAVASADNPLTARVMVNRLWMHHFGRGLVGTPSNFGALGERPTHPELLDWLARELVETGWSLKHLHRLMVTSAVYRLSSRNDEGNQVQDPDNRLLWRALRRRLDVESWRDALLMVSGELDRTEARSTWNLDAEDNRKRTVYAKVSRHELNGLLRLFDFPDANITSEKRTETTVPQQQLFVLNSPFMLARAKAVAARVQQEAEEDKARMVRLYEVVLGRAPEAEEARLGEAFLRGEDLPGEKAVNRLTRLERYAQVLLASNEFLYLD